jgi:hypothetical protein
VILAPPGRSVRASDRSAREALVRHRGLAPIRIQARILDSSIPRTLSVGCQVELPNSQERKGFP